MSKQSDCRWRRGCIAMLAGALVTAACKPAEAQVQKEATHNPEHLMEVRPVGPAMPPTDRPWTIEDLNKARKAIVATAPNKLPRRSEGAGVGFFARVADSGLLQPCIDHSRSVQLRMEACLLLLDAQSPIFRSYVVAQQRDLSYSNEVAVFMGSSMKIYSAMEDNTDEFIKTLDPADESYSVRMEGLTRFRNGGVSIVNGAITTLDKEAKYYSDESREALTAQFAELYLKVAKDLTPDHRQSLTVAFRRIATGDPSATVRSVFLRLSE